MKEKRWNSFGATASVVAGRASGRIGAAAAAGGAAFLVSAAGAAAFCAAPAGAASFCTATGGGAACGLASCAETRPDARSAATANTASPMDRQRCMILVSRFPGVSRLGSTAALGCSWGTATAVACSMITSRAALLVVSM